LGRENVIRMEERLTLNRGRQKRSRALKEIEENKSDGGLKSF